MKIICIMVSSLNGKILLGNTLSDISWTSKEDKAYFSSHLDKAACIIMGKNTYEAAKEQMVHRPGRLRIILTHNPKHYANKTIPGQLEFTSDSPSKLAKKLHYSHILLIGGATTNAAFLKENLIDELWLTLEPIVFESGIPLFADTSTQKLALLSYEKLNEKSTLLLKYRFSS